ncbi:MAG: alpha/beta hydrolase [Acidimicrobiia bacterium]|nr:alpha/beta hydrolase [Acidimicrobiia bacterium]
MGHTTSKDGATIGWEASGAGPALLLVHGTTADHTRWAGVAPGFESEFTVVAMDRRGRGGSADGPEYDLQREAEDVAAVVEAIGGPVRVVGHSYGAACSLEAALLTDGITRMVLYEPPIPTGLPMYPPGLPDRIQALIDNGELEPALELFFRKVVRMPDEELATYRTLPAWKVRIQLAPTIPRELAIDQHYEFIPGKYADLRIPVRLLRGGDSPELFRRAVSTLQEALPAASVAVLPNQQHIAMDLAPELFVTEVMGFLAE